jgi:hypothetical protein
MYGCSLVALGLPVCQPTFCVDHQNEVFLNVHDDRFDFSGKMPILHAECQRRELLLKTET